MGIFQVITDRHEKIKKRIHSMRYPLSKRGQRIMGVVYFCMPLIVGYVAMEYTTKRAKENLIKQKNCKANYVTSKESEQIQIENDLLRQKLKELTK